MKTSAELKTMQTEMHQAARDNNNIAATIAAGNLSAARRTVSAIEAGMKMNPKSERDINEAVAMYDAALQFTTPAPKDDKPPYAVWNGKTRIFDVQYW